MEVLEPFSSTDNDSPNPNKTQFIPKDWAKSDVPTKNIQSSSPYDKIGELKSAIDLFAYIITFINGPTQCMVKEIKVFAEKERPLDKEFLQCVGDYLKVALKSSHRIEFVCDSIRQKFLKEKRQIFLQCCKAIIFCQDEITAEDFELLARIADYMSCPRLILPKLLDPMERRKFEESMKIFGFSSLPDIQSLKIAFREKAKSSHPDKINGMDPEIRKFAERKFQSYLDAYNSLLKYLTGDYLLKWREKF